MIDSDFASRLDSSAETRFPLSPQQAALLAKYVHLLEIRRRVVVEEEEAPIPLSTSLPLDPAKDWRKYNLLLGKPGTGKSQVLKRLICSAVHLEEVAFCAPLAILVTGYREEFGHELYADTVHAMFHLPVGEQQEHSVNYQLGDYDLLLLDEASMVSAHNFALLHQTLEKQVRRPLVILAGDDRQQLPLETRGARTVQGRSILHSEELRKSARLIRYIASSGAETGDIKAFWT